MPLYRLNNAFLLLFVHIPKTGGSSVEARLREVGDEALNDMEYLFNRKNFSRTSAQHFHQPILDRVMPKGFADASFSLVRNPVDRLKSEFRYRQMLRKRYPRRWGRWLRSEPTEINDWFAESVQSFQSNPFLYDNHFRPQHAFLREDVKIFRLEDGMSPVFSWISQCSGQQVAPPNQRQVASNRDIPTELSPATLKDVREFYKEDFEKLGYN